MKFWNHLQYRIHFWWSASFNSSTAETLCGKSPTLFVTALCAVVRQIFCCWASCIALKGFCIIASDVEDFLVHGLPLRLVLCIDPVCLNSVLMHKHYCNFGAQYPEILRKTGLDCLWILTTLMKNMFTSEYMLFYWKHHDKNSTSRCKLTSIVARALITITTFSRFHHTVLPHQLYRVAISDLQ